MNLRVVLPLVLKLEKYASSYPEQIGLVLDFIRFLNMPDELPFFRENLSRHITASAWLVNPSETKVLLTHHRKLNMWVQLGGHCDGDSDVLAAAIREAEEESGIDGISPVSDYIYDIDKHFIPGRPGESEHFHYDIRFLLRAPSEKFSISAESKDLAWFDINDPFFDSDQAQSIQRMHDKWRTLGRASFDHHSH